jgi:hypothetical protein
MNSRQVEMELAKEKFRIMSSLGILRVSIIPLPIRRLLLTLGVVMESKKQQND